MEPIDKGFKADGFDGLDLHETPSLTKIPNVKVRTK
jgi:hypothetical protein